MTTTRFHLHAERRRRARRRGWSRRRRSPRKAVRPVRPGRKGPQRRPAEELERGRDLRRDRHLDQRPARQIALLRVVPARFGRDARRTGPAGAPAVRPATTSGPGCSTPRRSRAPGTWRAACSDHSRPVHEQVVEDAELPEVVGTDLLAGKERPARRAESPSIGSRTRRPLPYCSATLYRPPANGHSRVAVAEAPTLSSTTTGGAVEGLVAVEVRQVDAQRWPGRGRRAEP